MRKKAPFTKAQWITINSRRVSLINKKYDDGLTTQETKELAVLQEKAARYLDFFEGHAITFLLRQLQKTILILMDKEASEGLTKREKTELACLQKEAISWTMFEAVVRKPLTKREFKQMDRRAEWFTRRILGR